jgi:DNA-binding GntR family transcriptional regulator
MPKTRGVTHSAHVLVTLENDIFSGTLVPGAALDEEALAQRFNVSRTPVREAMLQLIQSGLVEKKPRQGAIVARTDVGDMIRLFEVMSELEGICAKYASRRMTEAERAALRDIHDRSEAALANGEADTYYKLSRQFHLAIIDGTHNDDLIDITNRMGTKLVPYRRFQLSYPGRSESNLADHVGILQAILDRDPETAAELSRKHTNLQGDVLAEYVATNSGKAAEFEAAQSRAG